MPLSLAFSESGRKGTGFLIKYKAENEEISDKIKGRVKDLFEANANRTKALKGLDFLPTIPYF